MATLTPEHRARLRMALAVTLLRHLEQAAKTIPTIPNAPAMSAGQKDGATVPTTMAPA